MNLRRPLFCALVASTALMHNRSIAQDLSACGDIRFEANVQCEVIPPSVACEAECTPVKLEASCAAELYVDCDGQCNASVEASCNASCEADCSAECTVDPGKFDCYASCEGACNADCDAACAANSNSANCQASCRATCQGSCSADCNVVPPSADCDARCQASCQGSCEAKANIDCQIDCQAGGYADCEARLEGGCRADCTGERGALFCDGQYVDPRDDIEACVAALQSALDIQVEGYADANAACDGGVCVAEASAGTSGCNVSGRDGQRGNLGSLWSATFVLGVGAVIRRRKR